MFDLPHKHNWCLQHVQVKKSFCCWSFFFFFLFFSGIQVFLFHFNFFFQYTHWNKATRKFGITKMQCARATGNKLVFFCLSCLWFMWTWWWNCCNSIYILSMPASYTNYFVTCFLFKGIAWRKMKVFYRLGASTLQDSSHWRDIMLVLFFLLGLFLDITSYIEYRVSSEVKKFACTF